MLQVTTRVVQNRECPSSPRDKHQRILQRLRSQAFTVLGHSVAVPAVSFPVIWILVLPPLWGAAKVTLMQSRLVSVPRIDLECLISHIHLPSVVTAVIGRHSSLVHALFPIISKALCLGVCVCVYMQVYTSVNAHMEARGGYRHVWPCWALSGCWGFELNIFMFAQPVSPNPSPLPQSLTFCLSQSWNSLCNPSWL